MVAADLRYLSIIEASELIHRKEISPVELAKECFARIEEVDGGLNSFVTVMEHMGMAQAMQAEQELAKGIDRGPLHGIPIALKDLYATKGTRTTAHSKVLLESGPDEDSTCPTRLQEAGTVLLGKL